MLSLANLGCLATNVIISAHAKTNEMAAKCLFKVHGFSNDESGTHRIIPTEKKIYTEILTEFSTLCMCCVV